MTQFLKDHGERIYNGMLLATAIFSLLVLSFVSIGMWEHRVIFYFMMMLILVTRKYLIGSKKGGAPVSGFKKAVTAAVDICFILILIVFLIYTLSQGKDLLVRSGTFPETMDVIIAVLLTIMTVEVGRRTTGRILPAITLILIAYCLFCNYLPAPFYHKAIRFSRVFSNLYSPNGIFGEIFGICTTYVVVFVIFGAFLERSGSGDFLIQFADILCGKQVGGTAKAAIVGSGLMGMINGSTVSNVMTVGSITIPMMQKSGIKAEIAAGIEAVASTGGQIMPPILGAAAFVMAETTGIPYSTIALGAVIPALFYYVTLYAQVHYYSKKNNITGIAGDRITMKELLRTKGYLSIPIILLILLLFIVKLSPLRAGMWSTLACFAVSWFHPAEGMRLKDVARALEKGIAGILSMVAICTIAATVIQLLDISGIGLAFTRAIMSLGKNSVFLALLVSAIISIILGMGMPTVPAYVLTAVVAAPALVDLGLDVFVAHFFVLYFSCMSSITPPIALGAYAASSIAKSDPTRTGFQAIRLGLAGLLAPFIVVYRPETLIITNIGATIYNALIALLGLVGLAISIEGYFDRPLRTISRIALFIAFCLMTFIPIIWTDVAGIIIMIAVFLFERMTKDAANQDDAA